MAGLRLESLSAQIWKPLLRRIGMAMFLVITKLIQSPGTVDSHDGAEHVGLFIIDFDQVSQFPLHIINGAANGRRLQSRGKGDVRYDVFFEGHSGSGRRLPALGSRFEPW